MFGDVCSRNDLQSFVLWSNQCRRILGNMAILSALIKSVQFCVVTYVSVAVLYTTQYLAARSVGHIWYPSLPTHVPPAQEDINSPNLRALAVTGHAGNVATRNVDSLSRDAWVDLWSAGFVSSEVVHLPSYGTAAANHSILEETLLSKAFSQAMHPTRIIPFYYRATGDIREDDVSITTLVTSNRFKVFKQLVERYQGPISVTVHIPLPSHSSFVSLPPTHPSVVALNSLHVLYSSTPLFSTYVDVHLALSPFTGPAAAGEEGEGGRQFNVWRNAARLFARTEFVMMLDVDFAVCTDWRSAIGDAIRQAKEEVNGVDIEGGKRDVGSREMVSMLREGSAALVVPAFEYVKQEDGADQRSFPTDKEASSSFMLLLNCR
ncbi:Glycosyltransferase-like protein gnt15 [Grifola frondosa]|uniref:Glycosyltransferase-like protein gnt15 n=1 Tax=Grifola frondosa TaxID=5627 RepID=A0A1C7M3X6_GRIFR|nr:Glycosyltransferase-like protein gnt15 [Grifola frondosa]